MITITRAVQTSIACPAQWDLWDADGNYYYARFRHGYGHLRRYETEDWVGAEEDQFIETVARFEVDGNDGWISLDEFAQRARITIADYATRAGFGHHVAERLAAEGIVAPAGSELDGIIGKWNQASG